MVACGREECEPISLSTEFCALYFCMPCSTCRCIYIHFSLKTTRWLLAQRGHRRSSTGYCISYSTWLVSQRYPCP